MSGLRSRNKGRRGQSLFAALLASRDWQVADISAGIQSEDILAIAPDGTAWCVEVKNTATITPAHKRQAIKQAAMRGQRFRWMLANHVEGSSSWLVQRQGERPAVWHQELHQSALAPSDRPHDDQPSPADS